MTDLLTAPTSGGRTATRRRFLMCRPTFFEVAYAINPWMDLSAPVDRDLAVRQWERLRAVYRELGHEVVEIEPVPGLPDMVFAANGGLVVDGRAMGVRFRNAERAGEAEHFLAWLSSAGYDGVRRAEAVNEGEGDFLVTPREILAGQGFRSDPASHAEVSSALGREVVPLDLVDPRYYHLDTALCVLDERTVGYFPGAFSPRSQAVLAQRFPDAVLASVEDAAVLGLNAVSDGRHVVLAAEATGFAAQLAERGFEPVPVELSELRKAGGSVKCCTLELRP